MKTENISTTGTVVASFLAASCYIGPAMTAVNGVKTVAVSYKKKTARLTAADSITDTVLVEAVRKAGYQATVVKRQPVQ